MPKLRLLIVSPYFPPHVGGLEGYVSDLNEELMLSEEVETITVLTPRLPHWAPVQEDRSDGYAVLRYPAFELVPNFPIPKLWKRELWRIVRRADPASHDVLVSHTRFFLTSALALLCARAVRRPLLHVEHGSDYVQLSSRLIGALARAYDLLLGRFVLRRADEVVAISHAAAEFVQRLAGREVEVIHRGIHAELLRNVPIDGPVLEWAAQRPVVTFLGRLIDGKGVADLLHAFSRARGTTTAVLCVVGDGPRRRDLELLAERLGIAAQVRFLGDVTQERAWAVIRASSVVVNPSYTEGLPTSVLEAALLAKAVLATDVGGTPEIVSDGAGGFLVPAHDIDALGSRLEQLLEDPLLRERMGEAARAEATGRFDWHVSAARFTEIVRGLASG